MQIVIDIDEDTYGYMQSRCEYQNKGDKGLSKFEEAGVAIKNGIPLPKGHGRLIDADKAIYEINEMKVQGETSIMAVILAKVLIRGSKTVIEADDEEGEG